MKNNLSIWAIGLAVLLLAACENKSKTADTPASSDTTAMQAHHRGQSNTCTPPIPGDSLYKFRFIMAYDHASGSYKMGQIDESGVNGSAANPPYKLNVTGLPLHGSNPIITDSTGLSVQASDFDQVSVSETVFTMVSTKAYYSQNGWLYEDGKPVILLGQITSITQAKGSGSTSVGYVPTNDLPSSKHTDPKK